jgi:hypothetical protein
MKKLNTHDFFGQREEPPAVVRLPLNALRNSECGVPFVIENNVCRIGKMRSFQGRGRAY